MITVTLLQFSRGLRSIYPSAADALTLVSASAALLLLCTLIISSSCPKKDKDEPKAMLCRNNAGISQEGHASFVPAKNRKATVMPEVWKIISQKVQSFIPFLL